MSKKTETKVETNTRNCLDLNLELPNGSRLQLTAPKDRDYWLFRAPLTEVFALVAVPVFGGVDLHLQSKKASDYVAPYEASPREIDRILGERLKGMVAGAKIAEALERIQAEIKAWRGCAIKRKAKGKEG